MTRAASCPDASTLQDLLQGKIIGQPAKELAGHLEKCPACHAVAQQLAGKDTHVEPVAPKPSPGNQPDPEMTQEYGNFLQAPQKPDEMGRLGPYRIIKVLGAGGMGVVYLAEDEHLRRKVALKVMKPAIAMNPEHQKRFLREAYASAAVRHQHLIDIYQVGEDNGVPFLAMPFLEGESLDGRLNREPRTPMPDLLRIGRQIAEGLAAAHAKGLVHRDIKPGNIWLEQSAESTGNPSAFNVRILDFGLARGAGEDVQVTQSGAIVGSPAFMAPEQARGEKADARSDLFSLGVVLYRMAVGRLPFQGNDTMSMLLALAMDRPDEPKTVHADVPTPVSDFIMRLLARDPKDRPQSARQVAEGLAALERDLQPANTVDRTDKPRARPFSRSVAAAVLGLAILGLLAWLVAPLLLHKLKETIPNDPAAIQPEVEPDPGKTAVVTPAATDKPFVLVRDGKDVRAFTTFPGVMNESAPGDVILIHGPGPLRIGVKEISHQGLTLRAAAGSRPRLTWDGALSITGSDFTVEGIDLVGTPTEHEPLTFGGGKASFRDCGLWLRSGVRFQGCSGMQMADCLVLSGNGIQIDVQGGEAAFTNCLMAAGAATAIQSSGAKGMRLRLHRCSFFASAVAMSSDSPVDIDAEGNLFLGDVIGTGPNRRPWAKTDRWSGKNNLYGGQVYIMHKPGTKEPTFGLNAWYEAIGHKEEGSKYADWNQLPREDIRVVKLPWAKAKPEIMALLEDARKRNELPDLGPDLSLVGPGDAYLKALEAEGRSVIEKDLRPEALDDGPFVLIRDGKAVKGFAACQPAVEGALDGDIVEVRSDRPFPGCRCLGKDRRLVIRAGPGYMPAIEGEFVVSSDRVAIEGFHFTKGHLTCPWEVHGFVGPGYVTRLANCTFEPGRFNCAALLRAAQENRVEVRNCRFGAGLQFQGIAGQTVAFHNCTGLGMTCGLVQDGDYRLEMDRCFWWHPGQWFLDELFAPRVNFQAKQARLAVQARHCLVQTGCCLLRLDMTPLDLKRLTWSGEKNVYRFPWGYVVARGDLVTLAEWLNRYPGDIGSREDLPQLFDPAQWRLLPGSAGSNMLGDGIDVGANLERKK